MQRRIADGHLCTVKTATGSEDLAARIVVAASGSWEPGVFGVADAARKFTVLIVCRS